MSEFENKQSCVEKSSEDSCKKLYFRTQDDGKFEISYEAAKLSGLFSTFIDMHEMDDEENEEKEEDDKYILLPNIESKELLAHVINFLEQYVKEPMNQIPKPVNSVNIKEMVGDWYAEFITSFDEDVLMKIILASNFLDIKPLLNLGCAQVATQIRQKSPEEIRKIFNMDKKEEANTEEVQDNSA